MNIHKQLKMLRESGGFSQEKLAELSKVTQKQVSLIEGGEDCYLSTMRRMLGTLGYDLAAIPIDMIEGGR